MFELFIEFWQTSLYLFENLGKTIDNLKDLTHPARSISDRGETGVFRESRAGFRPAFSRESSTDASTPDGPGPPDTTPKRGPG